MVDNYYYIKERYFDKYNTVFGKPNIRSNGYVLPLQVLKLSKVYCLISYLRKDTAKVQHWKVQAWQMAKIFSATMTIIFWA